MSGNVVMTGLDIDKTSHLWKKISNYVNEKKTVSFKTDTLNVYEQNDFFTFTDFDSVNKTAKAFVRESSMVAYSAYVYEIPSFVIRYSDKEKYTVTSMVLPDAGLFNFNNSMFEKIIIPPVMSEVGERFMTSSFLKYIDLSNVEKINNEAFSGCINLERLFIPSTCTHIGSKAFYDCYNLLNIFLPNTLTYIADDAFKGSLRNTKINNVGIQQDFNCSLNVSNMVFTSLKFDTFVTNLKDNSSTGVRNSLTINSTTNGKLTADQLTSIESKNWELIIE